MDKRMGRALARVGAGGALAAVLTVLAAGVVAAGPQRSSAAPTTTAAATQDRPRHAQDSRTDREVAVTTAPRSPTGHPARAVAPASRSGGAGPHPEQAARLPVTFVTVRRPLGPASQAPHAAGAPGAGPTGPVGFDVSQHQCGNLPSGPAAIAIVQVTGGALNNPPNPCYAREAAWAGAQLSVYLYLNGLPKRAPGEAIIGPAYRCARIFAVCRAYNFGFNWASHWVVYSRHLGFDPKLWWLDVEKGSGWTSTVVNDAVIRGAADGLRREGVRIGIYSTAYQWATIAGTLAFPGVPVWTAGAGNLTGPGLTATAYCSSGRHTFAGGRLTLVQWGYSGPFPGAYKGKSPYDQDYACQGSDGLGYSAGRS